MFSLDIATENTMPCAEADLLIAREPSPLARNASAVAVSVLFSGENVISMGIFAFARMPESKLAIPASSYSARPLIISLSFAEYVEATFDTASGFKRWFISDFLMAALQ